MIKNYIFLINEIDLGDEMVQSVPIFCGLRILHGLSAHGRRLRRSPMVFYEVRCLAIAKNNVD